MKATNNKLNERINERIYAGATDARDIARVFDISEDEAWRRILENESFDPEQLNPEQLWELSRLLGLATVEGMDEVLFGAEPDEDWMEY